MSNLTNCIRRRSRAALLVAAVGVSGVAAACDDFMKVTNPGAIENPALENPTYLNLMTNGVIGDFQPAFAWTALFSGVFTDELRNHHAFFENPEFDLRTVNNNNGTYILAVYNGLHRARFLADSVAGRMETLLADSAGRNLQYARVQAYAGYAWTLLGEQFCETPINRSAPVTSDKLLEAALQRFDKSIQAATAARAAAASLTDAAARNRAIATADSLANLSRVGAARAALGLGAYNPGARQQALQYAQAVPTYTGASSDFVFNAYYVRDNNAYSRRVSNPFFEFITSGRWFSLTGTPYEGQRDPRLPHSDTLYVAADGTRRIFPNSPSAFSTYDGTPRGRGFDAVSNIRLASALEARYIIAEVQGVSAANLTFINQRRALGGQVALPTTTSAGDFLAALREQRARDFYLDSHRMGDVRRYKRQYNVDLWPRGSYFGSATIQYGTQECWPIPISETF
ncbi:MAG TPA: hypothetical protein VHG28_21125 [Longimicrobiaceae bacterium]|nr:hypothetical protein [Longimicrobiaceae bacterium]